MSNTNTPELIPVSKWNDYFIYPSVGSLRQLIFHNTNKFAETVIRRIGKRQYIKVSCFNDWVEQG